MHLSHNHSLLPGVSFLTVMLTGIDVGLVKTSVKCTVPLSSSTV